MSYRSRYDSEREADLSKQSARGRSIARRGKDIKEFRASLPRGADPIKPWRFKQKEYTYSPNWRDADSEQLRKDPGDDAKSGWFGGLGRDVSTMASDLSGPIRESGLYGDLSTMGRDILINPAKKYLPGLMSLIPALGFGENREQHAENERILGDLYTDELRKSMVPGWELRPGDSGYEGSKRAYHDKYKELASLTDDADQKQFYLDQARTAYRNANVTRRTNYALGDLGFDTSAEAGVGAWDAVQGRQETEAERLARSGVDYGALSGDLRSGLEGTDAGKSFIKRNAIPKKGDTPQILDAISNFTGGNYRDKILKDLDAGYRRSAYVPPMTALNTPVTTEDIYPDDFEEGQEYLDVSPYAQVYQRRNHLTTEDPLAGIVNMGDVTEYTGVNPFREPFVPMEGPSPVDLPPYLSENTDWWTPEPEEKELIPRGVEELVMDQYGVDAPGVPRERKWPNTPPPGYGPPPPWYSRAWDWMKEGPWPTY